MDFLRMDFLRRNGGPGAGGQQDDVERLAADEQLRNQERQGGLQLEGGGAMEQHPEMQERGPSLLRRFPLGPPTLPAIFSSRNSAMRRHRERASTTTAATEATGANGGDESPKTPRFTIGMPPLPSTRLDLPHLARTWTNGSNADSRPGTAVAGSGGRPSTSRTAGGHPAMSGARSRGGHGPATQQNDANSNDDNDIDITADPLPAEPSAAAQRFGTRRHRRRFRGGDPEDLGPAEVADEGRERRDRRRKRHRRRRHHHTRLGSSDGARTGRSGSGSGSGNRSGGRSRPEPKRFLFCFPWIRSRRVRSQILRCFVSGLFLTLLLTVCKLGYHP